MALESAFIFESVESVLIFAVICYNPLMPPALLGTAFGLSKLSLS